MQPYFEATPGLLIAEEDIRRLILRGQASERIHLPRPVKLTRIVSALLALIVLSYAVLNAPALLIKTQYYVEHELLPQQSELPITPTAPPVPGSSTEPSAAPVPALDNNTIYIPRIEVIAPINWDIEGNDAHVLPSLQSGVVHLKGNAHPGEQGNVFIVGHSSALPWMKGNYKRIFALIPNLQIGDTITVVYNNMPLQYRVTGKKVVAPNDTSVLKNTDEAKLTLMTCVPIGTNLKRQIVEAEPVNPVLHSSTAPTTHSQTHTLPGAR